MNLTRPSTTVDAASVQVAGTTTAGATVDVAVTATAAAGFVRPLEPTGPHHGGVQIRREMLTAASGDAVSGGVRLLLLDADERVRSDWLLVGWDQVRNVGMEPGHGLVERGEPGGIGPCEMCQVGVGHLAVADDPGYRDVMVGGLVGPELVAGVARNFLQYRTGRLGALAFADQEPHEAALGDWAGGEVGLGRCEPCFGVSVVNVVINDQGDENVGVQQYRRHLLVFQRADVLGGDHLSEANDGQPGRRTVRQPARAALAESAAHEERNGLAERPMRIPGDRHYLRVKVGWNVNGRAHTVIIAFTHQDA